MKKIPVCFKEFFWTVQKYHSQKHNLNAFKAQIIRLKLCVSVKGSILKVTIQKYVFCVYFLFFGNNDGVIYRKPLVLDLDLKSRYVYCCDYNY